MPIISGLEHAKIIAIVDKETGDVNNYDWTMTKKNEDFFADPEIRKEFFAITVKNVRCDSLAELKAKFEVAREYLEADFKGTIQRAVARKHIRVDVNKRGLVGYDPGVWLRRKIRVSPLAHDDRLGDPELLVNRKAKDIQYQVDDHVLLDMDESKTWVRIEALHGDVMIGRDIALSITNQLMAVCQFSKEHVFAHRSIDTMRQRRWLRVKKQLKKAERNRQ